jgi:hypothetical protein
MDPRSECIPWPPDKASLSRKTGWSAQPVELGRQAGERSARQDVETRTVAKSIYAVGGMGLVGSVLLAFMMHHLLKVQKEQATSPVAQVLEDAFAEHLVGPVRIVLPKPGGDATMTVHMSTRPGVRREQLAAAADSLVWPEISRMQQPPRAVRFEIEDADGAPIVVVERKVPPLLQASPPPSSPPSPSPSPPARH